MRYVGLREPVDKAEREHLAAAIRHALDFSEEVARLMAGGSPRPGDR